MTTELNPSIDPIYQKQCDQIGQNFVPWAEFSIFGVGGRFWAEFGFWPVYTVLAGIFNGEDEKYEKSSDKVADFGKNGAGF